MEIVLTASGTRGDIQPAMALALGLKHAGHTVKIAAGSNFASWIRSHGFEAIPLLDMEAMMQSPDGIKWVEQGNNVMAQLRIMRKLINDHVDALTQPLIDHGRECELHISGFTSTDMVEVVAEKYGIRHIASALQPYRATRSGAATLVPITRRDSALNRVFGQIGDRFRWSVVRDAVTLMRHREGRPVLKAGAAIARINQTPLVNGYSAHVVPHPPDWTPESATVGYWFLDEEDGWCPPAGLEDFLSQTPTPIYVGFGSMSSADPKAVLDLTCEAVRMSGQRAVFVTGWSGLTEATVPDNVYILDKAPHSWLFERVSGVVHHGGSGTTAAGMRAGKPNFILPHMADQPFWGRRIHELCAGPKPVPRARLTAETFAERIKSLVTRSDFRRNAESLGVRIRAEDGVARGIEAIERFSRKGVMSD